MRLLYFLPYQLVRDVNANGPRKPDQRGPGSGRTAQQPSKRFGSKVLLAHGEPLCEVTENAIVRHGDRFSTQPGIPHRQHHTARATHAATELGTLLLQFPPWAARAAGVVSAHTAEQIISIVTIQTADRPAAVAVALAVVSEALRRPAVSPSR